MSSSDLPNKNDESNPMRLRPNRGRTSAAGTTMPSDKNVLKDVPGSYETRYVCAPKMVAVVFNRTSFVVEHRLTDSILHPMMMSKFCFYRRLKVIPDSSPMLIQPSSPTKPGQGRSIVGSLQESEGGAPEFRYVSAS